MTSTFLKGTKYDVDALRGDVFGGVTTAIIALPVSLAFGVASGMGAAAGLYSAIAIGFFASVFGGTKTQVSGPTAPTTIVMAAIMTIYSSTLAEALTIVIIAGILQVLFGISRVGRFIVYTPHVVVSGFMSGIGILIMVIQVAPFFGSPPVSGSVIDMVGVWPAAFNALNVDALILGLITLGCIIAWPKKLNRILPAPLLGLLIGTAIGIFLLSDAPIIGDVPIGLPPIFNIFSELPDISFLLGAIYPAFILAMLGSIDSLLTSLVADSLTNTKTKPNMELVGQGIGNIAAGFVSALPGAGATVNTVTNIRAGGSTPISSIIRSALLLALVLGLGHYVEPIPLAVLSAVLLKIGWDVVDWHLVLRIHRLPREQIFVLLITLLLTVFIDLIVAIAVGLIAAGMVHALNLEKMELDSITSVPILDITLLPSSERSYELEDYEFQARVGLLALKGRFTVASAHRLFGVLSRDIQEHEVVIFDFEQTEHIDVSSAMVIWQLVDFAIEENIKFVVSGLKGAPKTVLDMLDVFEDIDPECMVETVEEARQLAAEFIKD